MFRDLEIKKVYDSESEDLVNSFYIPALSDSVLYKRTTGFFSSGSLALAAAGIVTFIKNSGKMQLITGVEVSDEDYDAIRMGVENKYLLSSFRNEIENSDGANLDHLKLLAWMVSEDKLEIKIAVMPKSTRGIFHEKVGVLVDKNGDKISFSGSANETRGGWQKNREEFKVFRSWNTEENSYLEKDEKRFDKYWEGNLESFSVINLPNALKNEMLRIRPRGTELPEIEERIIESYNERPKIECPPNSVDDLFSKPKKKTLYDYQQIAVSNWKANSYTGILEMATGTGKTLTAMGAIEEVLKEKKRLLVVIAAPQKHLIEQWKEIAYEQLPDFLIDTCNGDHRNWRGNLDDKLFDYKNGIQDRVLIFTTYATMASNDFIEIFQKKYSSELDYFFIADEMHNAGANEAKKCMLDEFNLRLGLSATPERYFDDTGTEKIYQYFGDTVYEYTLKRAIDEGKLTKYNYYPTIAYMSDEEYERYLKLTKQIISNSNRKDDEGKERLDRLMMRRAEITKKTEDKYGKFLTIIKELVKEKREDFLLIYCQDTEQLDEVQTTINDFGLVNHKLTEAETTKGRKAILQEFSEGKYKALVAMNCLDEGIDVPATRTAIIMASTGNPRQYVQRRGRVLRKFEGKEKAYIYDFIVLPPKNLSFSLISKVERSIIKRELKRVEDFLETADNKLEIVNYLSEIMLQYGTYV